MCVACSVYVCFDMMCVCVWMTCFVSVWGFCFFFRGGWGVFEKKPMAIPFGFFLLKLIS